MSLKRNVLMSGCLLAGVALFSGFASAQGSGSNETAPTAKSGSTTGERPQWRKPGTDGRHHDRTMGMGMLRGVDLTDAQKTQLKSIMDANRPDQATMDEMRTLMTAKRDGTITADQQSRLAALKADAKVRGTAMRQQIDAILTPEQKAQMEQRKAQMRERRMEFRQKREQRKTDATGQPPASTNN